MAVWLSLKQKRYFCCINVNSTAIQNLQTKALHVFYIFHVNLPLHLGPSSLNYPFTFCSSLNPVTQECKHFFFFLVLFLIPMVFMLTFKFYVVKVYSNRFGNIINA